MDGLVSFVEKTPFVIGLRSLIKTYLTVCMTVYLYVLLHSFCFFLSPWYCFGYWICIVISEVKQWSIHCSILFGYLGFLEIMWEMCMNVWLHVPQLYVEVRTIFRNRFSFHLHSVAWTQVIRLALQTLLPEEPPC